MAAHILDHSLIGPTIVDDFGFSRIAIVNRGEAAVRLIHAAAELTRERGAGLTTIALHTEAERTAMFARMADEGLTISSAHGSPYLDYEELERALIESGADAAWVGWGFVAEHPEFADLCARLGISFVGPPGPVMRALGDKIGAKVLAEQAGVPVAIWSGGPVETLEEATRHATTIGFPLLIKASAGGGGRGIRRVDHADQMAEAFERARDEAAKSFGDPTVFMERLVTGARHVEVQIAADHHGTVWALGVRDCSIQRKNQKVIEESSSPVLIDTQNDWIGRAATDLARAAGYRNVGTVEFLYQPQEDLFAFLEVNTRLQVEHPVTEMTTGLDLVKLQLEIAGGARLEGTPPARSGHAIEARLNAEDPQHGFAPAPGRIDVLRFGTGPGVRIDTGVAEGDTIPSEYDAMVAKVLAWGRDRDEARARLLHALEETTVGIEGGTTNKAFLVDLLNRPAVVDGSADTQWLDRLTAAGEHLPDRHGAIALIAAAVDAYHHRAGLEHRAFYASAVRGRPQTSSDVGLLVDCRLRGAQYRIRVRQMSPTRFRFEMDGHVLDAEVEALTGVESRFTVRGVRYRVTSAIQGVEHLIEVDGIAHRVSRDDAGTVRAPSPALVIAVHAEAGRAVEKGAPILVVEAMKMETTIVAPFSGTVTEVSARPGLQVDAGAVLLRMEAAGEEDEAAPADAQVDFATIERRDSVEGSITDRCLDLVEAVRWMVLGADVERSEAIDALAEYREATAQLEDIDPRLMEAELAVLSAFADLSSLSRNHRAGDTDAAEAHNPREYFHQYLRSLDIEAEGLPPSFRAKVERAALHYGVISLDPSPELEQAAHRIFVAQQRAPEQLPIIEALLTGPPIVAADLPEPLAASLRSTLDRLVTATELRFPLVGDLARRRRYETFDEPEILATREATLREMRERLLDLREQPASRARHLPVLMDCPEPLVPLLAGRDGDDVDDPILEVLTGRYYRIVDHEPFQIDSRNGRQVLTAGYHNQGEDRRVVSTVTDHATFAAALETVAAYAAEFTDARPAALELYTRWDGAIDDPDSLPRLVISLLEATTLPHNLRRVSISGCTPAGSTFHHTIRPVDSGFREETALRGWHPMIANRLQVRRFPNFDLERLPSPQDVYLFRATAHENPSDQRFLAFAEVRNMRARTTVDGRIHSIPELERNLAACANALRAAQLELDPARRNQLNRIHLYVWPTVAIPVEDFGSVVARLVPLTNGLGLEETLVLGKLFDAALDAERPAALRIAGRSAAAMAAELIDPPSEPIQPLDRYTQNVLAARRRGSMYPYELIGALSGSDGRFTEHDLDASGRPVAVERPPGGNDAGIVFGLVSTPTATHPDGMTRVAILGDPTKSLGSITEAECRRILAAIDLADHLGVPVEWFSVSAGARIAMDTGTENMDWIARVLRRIVAFTQAGGEINVVVSGINVGAQPYWNAEATMLMHTKGILVMTPDSAMVLTGKQALDYSGGVSAEDNFGIGGYDRIMGPNGQAQYWAPDLTGACEVLFAHYAHGYVVPGERFPRSTVSTDPRDRDVRSHPHEAPGFETVGEIFSETTNPGRKKPFDIRSLMDAVSDQDHIPLERWGAMRDAETAVVYDTRLAGHAVTMIGIESRPLPRHGLLPADGPDQWTAGTLFPLSSKKVARGINGASGSRPVVILANLSGFDGSPESLARLQLEYGAEIGRAMVNFDGPIVFCVVSRYHGGAFVVFSGALNDNMEVLAVEGTYASVLGGAPAAAVVFAREVEQRTEADPRITALHEAIEAASGDDLVRLRAELRDLWPAVHAEKIADKAAEFDAVHSVQRAMDVGSVDRIIPASRLRPELIAAIERGTQRTIKPAAGGSAD